MDLIQFSTPAPITVVGDGASIEAGGLDPADHNVRDAYTLLKTFGLLSVSSTIVNIAVSGANNAHLGSVPYQADRSRTVYVLGNIWPNAIASGAGESAEQIYFGPRAPVVPANQSIVETVAAALALGITKFVLCTGYALPGFTGPQNATIVALNALIRAGKGGYAGSQIAEYVDASIDATVDEQFSDHAHPTCPGSALYPGDGSLRLARRIALAVNRLV